MKKTILHLLFLLIVIGVFISGAYHYKQLEYLTKPLILIWIAIYFKLNSEKTHPKIIRYAMAAFLFSCLGDILLMFGGKSFNWFISGLFSFFISQIIYTVLFKKSVQNATTKLYLLKFPYLLILYLLYGTIFYVILFPELDNTLRVAILFYMIAILTMSAMALNRKENVNVQSFWMVFAGSVLFIISDSLIAINKFHTPIENERVWIMGTYISAQYLIMSGLLKQNN